MSKQAASPDRFSPPDLATTEGFAGQAPFAPKFLWLVVSEIGL
jgi:hypothetical protein